MANFKGGFAFNNGPAKVVVEQAPDGTLVSCVNPVTGDSLNAENYSEVITGTTAAPLPDVDLAQLYADIKSGNASASMAIDGSALGITEPIEISLSTTQIYNEGGSIITRGVAAWAATISGGTLLVAFDARWFEEYPANNYQEAYMGGTVATLPALPTVTTIYYHPMP